MKKRTRSDDDFLSIVDLKVIHTYIYICAHSSRSLSFEREKKREGERERMRE